jgi:hypothetical protein
MSSEAVLDRLDKLRREAREGELDYIGYMALLRLEKLFSKEPPKCM